MRWSPTADQKLLQRDKFVRLLCKVRSTSAQCSLHLDKHYLQVRMAEACFLRVLQKNECMVYCRAVSGPLAEELFCLATLPTLPHIRFLVPESLEYIPTLRRLHQAAASGTPAQSPQCTVYTRDFQKQKPDVLYTSDQKPFLVPHSKNCKSTSA